MEDDKMFADLDDETIYGKSQARACQAKTLNFAVEFGKEEARIAFDLSANDIQALLESSAPQGRPVRWINIWAPHRQLPVVDLLGNHYGFSPRLLAIIRSEPEVPEPQPDNKHEGHHTRRQFRKDDVELATTRVGLPSPRSAAAQPRGARPSVSHYSLAQQMINYQSIDIGAHFLCIGANFMHELTSKMTADDNSIVSEGAQRRLWSWLVLCDDHTVITFHEYSGVDENEKDLASMRANTLSVLSQLSKFGHDSADPISMQTVRQTLKLDAVQNNLGIEGASNLYYYLFDDWRAVYHTVAMYQQRLEDLQTTIFNDMDRKSNRGPDLEIIPRLHVLGRKIRQVQHLYEGYKNLIQRILEPKSTSLHGSTTPRSLSGFDSARKGVVLAPSAYQRFERLGDRLQLLMLNETAELLAEKDALISTYFNINAQKDSELAARLTRNATLLARLGAVFLPVSLMTSYFSVQISDLQGVYTVKDYWYSFAGVMGGSFLALFFFGRLLMWISETLDIWVKQLSRACATFMTNRVKRKEAEKRGV